MNELLLVAVMLSGPVAAQDVFTEACENELRLLCPDERGEAARRCLLEDGESLTVGCRSALGQAARAEDFTGPRREARLLGLKGPVYLHVAGRPEGEYVEASSGTPLAEGDWVRVGAGASAELSIDGDTHVALSSGSDLGVTSLAAAGLELRLALGSLAAKVRKLATGQNFRVRTPTVVAAVRGTEFIVEEDADGGAGRVGVVDEGRVEVSSEEGGEPVFLERRQETVIRPGRPPEAPRALEALRRHADGFADVRRHAAETARAWRPMPPEARASARNALAQRPAVGPGGMRGLAPGQQNRPSPGNGFRDGPGGGGPGRGPGNGPGRGDGPGRGPGNGPGRGDGPGRGPGNGPGRGDGPGRGPGNGPGRGDGPGRGPGNGPGRGPGGQDRQDRQGGPGRQDGQGPRGGGPGGGPGGGGPGGGGPGGGGPPPR